MLDQKELYNHMEEQHGLILGQDEMDSIIHLVIQGLREEHPEYFPAPSIPPPSITGNSTPPTSLFDKLEVGNWIRTRPYIGGDWNLEKVLRKSKDKILLLGASHSYEIHREEIDEGDYFRPF
jgi:hypothetical protein